MEFTLEYTDNTYKTKYSGDTSLDITLTFTHPTSPYVLVIELPNLEIESFDDALEAGVLSVDVSNFAIEDGSGVDLKITMTDNTECYYTEEA